MYMVRIVWKCARGKVPECLEMVKEVRASWARDGNTTGKIELPIIIPETSPLHDEFTIFIEFLHAEIRAVDHIEVSTHSVNGDSPRRIKLAFSIPAPTEFQEVLTEFAVKFLDPMVIGVTHIHVTFPIAGNTGGVIKIPVGLTKIPPQQDKVTSVFKFLNAVVSIIYRKN